MIEMEGIVFECMELERALKMWTCKRGRIVKMAVKECQTERHSKGWAAPRIRAKEFPRDSLGFRPVRNGYFSTLHNSLANQSISEVPLGHGPRYDSIETTWNKVNKYSKCFIDSITDIHRAPPVIF